MRKYLSYILIVLGVAGFWYFNNQENKVEKIYQPLNVIQTTKEVKAEEKFYAEIKGEVRYPGVYQISKGEILKSLIDKAGGLTEKADISTINQAQLVTENSLFVIPKMVSEDFYHTTEEKFETVRYIYVDIKGEVKYPGVYRVELGKRVHDCIELAGGFTDLANSADINLSEIAKDGMVIQIPRVIAEEKIRIYIGGEVNRPGYYEVNKGMVLSELIILAGELTEEALIDTINFTQVLVNGDYIIIDKIAIVEKIYVSIKGEVKYPNVYFVEETITIMELIKLAGGLTENAKVNAIDYNQVLVLGSVVTIPSISNSQEDDFDFDSDLININTASLDELMELVGIGEIYGQRIIDYRIENGYFTTIEEIMLVSGIKQSVYEAIKDNITV